MYIHICEQMYINEGVRYSYHVWFRIALPLTIWWRVTSWLSSPGKQTRWPVSYIDVLVSISLALSFEVHTHTSGYFFLGELWKTSLRSSLLPNKYFIDSSIFLAPILFFISLMFYVSRYGHFLSIVYSWHWY